MVMATSAIVLLLEDEDEDDVLDLSAIGLGLLRELVFCLLRLLGRAEMLRR